MPLKLILANKAYSSWSLRPWILLAQLKIPFEEVVVPMDQPDTRANMLKYAPTGKCPSLQDGKIAVWESLAIIEYIAETHPEKKVWPKGKAARAHARSLSSEMHAGFGALRQACPTNFRRPVKAIALSDEVRADVVAHRSRVGACARDLRQGGSLSVRALLRRRRDVCAGDQPLPCLRRAGLEADARLYGDDHGSAGVEGMDRRRPCRAVADRAL